MRCILGRYTGLRTPDNAKVCPNNLIIGQYYYVLISRRTNLNYEFIAEYIGNDFKNRPTFLYESTLNGGMYKWHTRTSDDFYNLIGSTPLSAELLQGIIAHGSSKNKAADTLADTATDITPTSAEPTHARWCAIM